MGGWQGVLFLVAMCGWLGGRNVCPEVPKVAKPSLQWWVRSGSVGIVRGVVLGRGVVFVVLGGCASTGQSSTVVVVFVCAGVRAKGAVVAVGRRGVAPSAGAPLCLG